VVLVEFVVSSQSVGIPDHDPELYAAPGSGP